MRARTIAIVCSAAPMIALAVWEGCAVYDSSLLTYPDVAPGDAGDAQTETGPSCHKRWPARPLQDDDASVQNVEFYNAVRDIDFGSGDSGSFYDIGFDLDNFCTCPEPDSCKPFGDAGTRCDEDGGIDNAGGLLLRQFSGVNFFDQDVLNGEIAAGQFGAIIRVRNYNGQANDTKVEASLFVSNGSVNAIADAGPPKFDGTDVWTIDPTSLLGGTIAGDAGPVPLLAYDLNAYVSNYTLVANISDMPLALGSATGAALVTIELTGAIVVAKLTPLGTGQFQTRGTVTGRWASNKLLTSLQVLHDPLDIDASFCGNDPIYQLLKPRICDFQDIASNVLDDGKGAPCNALSIAFNFTSVPATYGSVFPRPDAGGGCGPTWTDQCGN